jgi:hypothetical protein
MSVLQHRVLPATRPSLVAEPCARKWQRNIEAMAGAVVSFGRYAVGNERSDDPM